MPIGGLYLEAPVAGERAEFGAKQTLGLSRKFDQTRRKKREDHSSLEKGRRVGKLLGKLGGSEEPTVREKFSICVDAHQ